MEKMFEYLCLPRNISMAIVDTPEANENHEEHMSKDGMERKADQFLSAEGKRWLKQFLKEDYEVVDELERYAVNGRKNPLRHALAKPSASGKPA